MTSEAIIWQLSDICTLVVTTVKIKNKYFQNLTFKIVKQATVASPITFMFILKQQFSLPNHHNEQFGTASFPFGITIIFFLLRNQWTHCCYVCVNKCFIKFQPSSKINTPHTPIYRENSSCVSRAASYFRLNNIIAPIKENPTRPPGVAEDSLEQHFIRDNYAL